MRSLRDALPAGFLQNLSWQYVSSIAAGLLTFAYAVLVGALLGATNFGLLSLALGFVTVVFQLVELRLHEAVIRYVAEFSEAGDHARMVAALKLFFAADALTGVLAFLIACAASPVVAAYLLRTPNSAHVVLLAAASVLMLNVGTATALGIYRVFGEFRRYAIITTAGALAKLVLTVAGIRLLGWNVAGVLAAATIAHFATNAVLIGRAWSVVRARVERGLDAPFSLLRDRMPELRRFVGHTYLLSVSMIPTKELDTNILGVFAPLPVVGVYKYAKTFAVAILTLADPVFFVVYPELARMWVRRQFNALRRFVGTVAGVMAAAASTGAIVAIVVVPWAMSHLGGGQYTGAAPIFRWMMLAIVFWAPMVWVNPLLMAAGRPDLSFRASVCGSALVLVAYLVLIPLLGAIGAAIAYALASPAVMVFAVAFGRRAGILFPAEASA